MMNFLYPYLSRMATKKDKRYHVIKVMLQANGIKSFKEIFKVLPKSTVARDLRTNNNRMTRMIEDPDQFTLGEIRAVAKLIGIDYMVLLVLIDKG
jgi:predicted DNA-binding ArsR family transcriptional regulator